jgi:hypothetical protein
MTSDMTRSSCFTMIPHLLADDLILGENLRGLIASYMLEVQQLSSGNTGTLAIRRSQ